MQLFLPYQKPPMQRWQTETTEKAGVTIWVRREDQNHPFVSGNKWWKLKYNLLHALANGFDTVVTFGGAYSNHIYATAAACQELGLKSVGIIRGEKTLPLNGTLGFAKACAMELQYVSRETYRNKNDAAFLKSIVVKYGRCLIIPEGGTNEYAVRGCEELGHDILNWNFDYCCLPVGTGGTMAGLINGFQGAKKIMGIPVLKDGAFLLNEIKKYLTTDFDNWQLLLDYHLGGYAKTNTTLNKFIHQLSEQGLHTEFVYSAKLFWALQDLIDKGFFDRGSTVLALHTGGLRPT